MAAEYKISNYTRYKSASKFAAGPLHFSEERKTRMSDRDQSKGDLICGGFEGKEKYKKGAWESASKRRAVKKTHKQGREKGDGKGRK